MEKDISYIKSLEKQLEITEKKLRESEERFRVTFEQRDHIHKRIRESELKYRSLIENSLEGFGIIKGEYFIFANKVLLDIFGYSDMEEFIKIPAIELIADDSKEKLLERMIGLTNNEHIDPHMQYKARKKNGELFIFEASVSLLTFRNGNYIQCNFRDITEQKRSETALKDSEERFRLLVENSPDTIMIMDLNGIVTYISDQVIDLLGYKPEDYIGKGIPEYVHPDDMERVTSIIASAISETKPANLEYRFYNANREIRWISHKIRPFFSNGQVSGFQSSIRDITDRIKSQEALRLSEERFRGLFEAMTEGVAMHEIIYDTEGKPIDYKITDVNSAYTRIIGIPKDEAVGVKATELYKTNMPPFFDIYDEASNNGNTIKFEAPFEPLKKYFSISVFSLFKGQFTTIFEDITDRKKAEEELIRLNSNLEDIVMERTERLNNAFKEMEAFSYSVSHDLRTPLRSIAGFSRILLEDYRDKLDDAGFKYLERINEAGGKMGLLVDGLLNLSRLSLKELVYEKVNLSKIVRYYTSQLTESEPEREIKLIVPDDIIVRGDKELLHTVIYNLLSNSWKYTSKHTKASIEFGVLKNSNENIYFIKDDGAGFDMAYSSKLFIPFQRLHGNKEFEGLGVGLSTVQRIIHKHKGRIWAESEVEKGAVFYFTLNCSQNYS